jgi:L-lactate utilization protein LutB
LIYPGPIGAVISPQLQSSDPATCRFAESMWFRKEACPVAINLPDVVGFARKQESGTVKQKPGERTVRGYAFTARRPVIRPAGKVARAVSGCFTKTERFLGRLCRRWVTGQRIAICRLRTAARFVTAGRS